jgi:hypothetical protein
VRDRPRGHFRTEEKKHGKESDQEAQQGQENPANEESQFFLQQERGPVICGEGRDSEGLPHHL